MALPREAREVTKINSLWQNLGPKGAFDLQGAFSRIPKWSHFDRDTLSRGPCLSHFFKDGQFFIAPTERNFTFWPA